MPRSHVRPLRFKITFGQVQVGAADAAAQHLDQELPGAWLWYLPFDQPKRSRSDRTWVVHDPRAHEFRIGEMKPRDLIQVRLAFCKEKRVLSDALGRLSALRSG